tara:strand:+ start:237 stop:449 length:213 start_codon:yes stop_codon:yes gene_type:complete
VDPHLYFDHPLTQRKIYFGRFDCQRKIYFGRFGMGICSPLLGDQKKFIMGFEEKSAGNREDEPRALQVTL